MTHVCGASGCHYVPDNPERDKHVEAARMEWTQRWKDEHGDYPELDEQVDFIIRESDHYDAVIAPRIGRERIEAAHTEARREYMRRSIPSLPQSQQGGSLQHGSRCILDYSDHHERADDDPASSPSTEKPK